MKKFKFFINFAKEERWLETMAENGWQLKSAVFCYDFYSAPSEQAAIRIDCRTFKNNQDFLDYCALFEDSGWKHIAGSKHSGNQYFKKISEDSNDDIFSDSVSRAGRYKRLSNMWGLISVIYWLPILVELLSSGGVNLNGISNPKSLYYTPGLWEMSGFEFWGKFLFETPFAFFRGYWWISFLVMIGFYIFFFIKSRRLYNSALNNKS